MWGGDSAEDLLETHQEGGDVAVAENEAGAGDWEEGDGMGMIGDHKPGRMTRKRSLSIPDSLAGLVSGLEASGMKVKAPPSSPFSLPCPFRGMWFRAIAIMLCSSFCRPVPV